MRGRLLLGLLCLLPGLAAGQILDSFSREFSAYRATLPPSITDAVSREFSVYRVTTAPSVTDAMSREFTVYRATSAPQITDAVSRELSVYRDTSPPHIADAVSREFSVYRATAIPPTTDAVSREFSVFRDTSLPQIVDAMSREFSAYRTTPAPAITDAISRESSVWTPPVPVNLTVAAQDVSVTPGTLEQGAAATLRAVVRNTGDLEAIGVRVAFHDGHPDSLGRPIGETVVSVPGRGQTTAQVNWTGSWAGVHRLWAFVDPAGEIAEAAEEDNRAWTGASVVNPALQPSLVVPGVVAAGDVVTLKLKFRNTGASTAREIALGLVCDDSVGYVGASRPPRAGSTTEWTLPDLAAGQSDSVTVSYEVPHQLAVGTMLVFRAHVTYANGAGIAFGPVSREGAASVGEDVTAPRFIVSLNPERINSGTFCARIVANEPLAAAPTAVLRSATNQSVSADSTVIVEEAFYAYCTISPDFASGAGSVEVSGNDLAGNATSVSHGFTVDRTAPTITFHSEAGVIGASNREFFLNASETLAQPPSVGMVGSGGLPFPVSFLRVSGFRYYYRVTIPAGAGSGMLTATFDGSDQAGNSFSGSAGIPFDGAGPSLAISHAERGPLGTFTIQVTSNEVLPAAPTLSVVDAGNHALSTRLQQIQGLTYSFSVELEASATAGLAAVSATARDLEGNTTVELSSFMVDVVAPQVALVVVPTGPGQAECRVSTNEPLGAATHVDARGPDGSTPLPVTLLSGADGLWTFGVMASALSYVRVEAVDVAGNRASDVVSYVNLHVGAADIRFSAPPDGNQDVTATTRVHNTGSCDVTGLRVVLSDMQGPIGVLGDVFVAAGDSAEASVVWPAARQRASYLVVMSIDSPGVYAETDESDNTAERGSYSVMPAADRPTYVHGIDGGALFWARVFSIGGGEALGPEDVDVQFSLRDASGATVLGPAATQFDVQDRRFTVAIDSLDAFAPGSYVLSFRAQDYSGGSPVIGERSVSIAEDYAVNLTTDETVYDRAGLVRLSGEVHTASGQAVVGAQVAIIVEGPAGSRSLRTTTGTDGRFHYDYRAPATEAGSFSALAQGLAGQVRRDSAAVSFLVLGLGLTPTTGAVNMSANNAVVRDFVLRNYGTTALTGVTTWIEDQNGADGVSFRLVGDDVPAELAPGATATFGVEVVAELGAAAHATAAIRATSAEGCEEAAQVTANVVPARPVLAISKTSIQAIMMPGQSRTVSTRIENTGYDALRGAILDHNMPSWITSLQNGLVGELPRGEAVTLQFLLQPSAEAPLGPQEFTIRLLSDNYPTVTIPLRVWINTDQTGNLTVHALDDGGASIAGARVTLYAQRYDPVQRAYPVLQQDTDSNGLAHFSQVGIGDYRVLGSAAAHDNQVASARVEAGGQHEIDLILVYRPVTVQWTVQPTTIQDVYHIEVQATHPYQAAILQATPVWAELEPGEDRTGSFRIQNVGQAPAVDIVLTPPSPPLFRFSMTLLSPPTIPELLPGESRRIDYQVSASTLAPHGDTWSGFVEVEGFYADPAGTTRPVSKNAPVTLRTTATSRDPFGCLLRPLSMDPPVALFGLLGEMDGDPDHEHIAITNHTTHTVTEFSPAFGVTRGYSLDSYIFGLIPVVSDLYRVYELISGPGFQLGSISPQTAPPEAAAELTLEQIYDLPSVFPSVSLGLVAYLANWDDGCSSLHVMPVAGASLGLVGERTIVTESYPSGANWDLGCAGCGDGSTGGRLGGIPAPPPIVRSDEHQNFFRISFSQQATMERDAFQARLEITNGMTSAAVSGIRVRIETRDEDDVLIMDDVTDADGPLFFMAPSLSGLDGVGGQGEIGPGATGSAEWTIIPKPTAGGEDENGRRYRLRAVVEYLINGYSYRFPLAGQDVDQEITVYPQPLLRLHYFMPDRFVPGVETMLGVRVENVGHGTARSFHIQSPQPRTEGSAQVAIIGAEVDGEPAGDLATLDFGDLSPGSARVGSWRLAVSGEPALVSEMSAECTHEERLGGMATSLIADATTSILLTWGDVGADQPPSKAVLNPGRETRIASADHATAFVLDEDRDGAPDWLLDGTNAHLLTVGTGQPVILAEPTFDEPLLRIRLEGALDGSWSYCQVPRYFPAEMEPRRITRNDGKVLDQQAFWWDATTVHLIDGALGTKEYSVLFERPYPDVDLRAVGIALEPEPVMEGARATFTGLVSNAGTQASLGASAEFYVGHPDSGGVPIGDIQMLPSIDAGDTARVQTTWATRGFAGVNRVFLVADRGGLNQDPERANNLLAREIAIAPPPNLTVQPVAGADSLLVVSDGLAPGDTIAVSATIGLTCPFSGCDPGPVQVGLTAGPAGGPMLPVGDCRPVWFELGATTASLTWTWEAPASGVWVLGVRVDPQNEIHESAEDDNVLWGTVHVDAALNVGIVTASVVIEPQPVLEHDVVTMHAAARFGPTAARNVKSPAGSPGNDTVAASRLATGNEAIQKGEPGRERRMRGLVGNVNLAGVMGAVDSVEVALMRVGPDSAAVELLDSAWISVPDTVSVVPVTMHWLDCGSAGTYTLCLEIDRQRMWPEVDRSDNRAWADVVVERWLDHQVFPRDLVVSPEKLSEGEPLGVALTVHAVATEPPTTGRAASPGRVEVLQRTGGVSDSVVVRLYLTRPDSGGSPLGHDLKLPGIAAGDSARATTTWRVTGMQGAYSLHAHVDPDSLLREPDRTNDVVTRQFLVLPDTTAPPAPAEFTAVIMDSLVQLCWRTVPVSDQRGVMVRCGSETWPSLASEGTLAAVDSSAATDTMRCLSVSRPPPGERRFYSAFVFDEVPNYSSALQAPPVGGVTAVAAPELPVEFALHSLHPNPANGGVTVVCDLPRSSHLEVEIYQVDGRRVCAVSRGARAAGRHEIRWDGRDRVGRPVASGVYLVRMSASGFRAERKLVLLK